MYSSRPNSSRPTPVEWIGFLTTSTRPLTPCGRPSAPGVEHFLGELDDAFHLRAAAGEHDARGDHLVEAERRSSSRTSANSSS